MEIYYSIKGQKNDKSRGSKNYTNITSIPKTKLHQRKKEESRNALRKTVVSLIIHHQSALKKEKGKSIVQNGFATWKTSPALPGFDKREISSQSIKLVG
jgi:hypothetical protein